MITKFLVTAAIIIGVVLYLRHRGQGAASAAPALPPGSAAAPFPVPFRWLSYALAALVTLGAAGYLLYDYHDSHRLLSIRVVNPVNGEEVEYKVLKGKLENRRFETVNGQQIRVSDSERLVIEAID
ncbi:hypothetical protein [Aestuariirhabdus litorea]|uniref:Antitermination protein NusG n=1 Tax=Aestuariirhabdus litorea TaxID=2528527 RepID=A0A3P3VMH6_9GAMM|nr:hypothetical protein [Aestuariirhabdus litorea]RRJ83971.1 hypothetical protein D0544_02295 [Aestuariirhabdus litorea]RWW97191.1 hypothetical protein DZC74_02290 [Endozoicomonadaceae bacterium GTF-13]